VDLLKFVQPAFYTDPQPRVDHNDGMKEIQVTHSTGQVFLYRHRRTAVLRDR
jgi:hypothetical protein